MKVTLEIDIDKQELLTASEEDDIKLALMKEMGWLTQSGISLSKIISMEDE